MRREAIDEEDLLFGFRMRSHYRMLGVRKLGLQRQTFFDRHCGAECRFDTVARAKAGDLRLDVFRQLLICERHVGPHGVTADLGAFHAAQHAAERRLFAPAGIGVPGVLVAVVGRVGRFVNANQTGMIGIAADHWMIFEVAEITGEGDVLGARNVLIAEEQYLVGQQQRPDCFHQRWIARRNAKVDVADLRADRTGQWLDFRGRLQYRRRQAGRGLVGPLCNLRHGTSSTVVVARRGPWRGRNAMTPT